MGDSIGKYRRGKQPQGSRENLSRNARALPKARQLTRSKRGTRNRRTAKADHRIVPARSATERTLNSWRMWRLSDRLARSIVGGHGLEKSRHEIRQHLAQAISLPHFNAVRVDLSRVVGDRRRRPRPPARAGRDRQSPVSRTAERVVVVLGLLQASNSISTHAKGMRVPGQLVKRLDLGGCSTAGLKLFSTSADTGWFFFFSMISSWSVETG